MKNRIFRYLLSFIRYLLFSFVFVFILDSCSVEQKPIEYGSDKCDYCEMTIVDNKFGAEIVNNNGKVFKFDAAECMFRYINDGEIKIDNIALALVTAFDKPGILNDAKKSFFLISENLPSPMGGFLSSYDNEISVKKFHNKYGGVIYKWDDVLVQFHGVMDAHQH